MISSGIDPQMVARQADAKDLVRFKQEMDGLKQRLSGDGDGKEKELRKACQDFEAVFISKLWKGMKSTVPKEGYLHSKQEEQYMSMFDRQFAEKMAQAGGIGLADMIYAQLSEKLKNTSRTTLSGGVDIKPLEPQPIALNQPTTKGTPLNASDAMTLEDWGGSASAKNVVEVSAEAEAEPQRHGGGAGVLTDVEVKARLDELTRKLEAERLKAELLATQPNKQGEKYGKNGSNDVGRDFAKIG